LWRGIQIDYLLRKENSFQMFKVYSDAYRQRPDRREDGGRINDQRFALDYHLIGGLVFAEEVKDL